MAFILKDRVQETSTTTGTGDFTLAGAVSNHKSFSSVCSVSDTFWYTIVHAGTAWETGIGTYSGANTLNRTTVIESSNANAAVNFTAGTKDVFITLPASKALGLQPSTTSATGVVELATTAEMRTGTDASRVPSVEAVRDGTGAGWASFSAHKNGTSQTGVAINVRTQVTFGTEDYDIGGHFASHGWTPPAGKVRLTANIYISGATTVTNHLISIFKNGVQWREFSRSGNTFGSIEINADDHANGTDVYTVYATESASSGSSTILGGAIFTNFSGHMIN